MFHCVKCVRIWTRKNLYMDAFHAVFTKADKTFKVDNHGQQT